MTDKEVKKLKRVELLEMMIEQGEENERLRSRVSSLEEELSKRRIVMDEAGSIAEASLRLSNVFGEAQKAADDYLSGIRLKVEQTDARCAEAEQKTKDFCRQSVAQAKDESEKLVAEAKQKVSQLEQRCSELQSQIDAAVKELKELDSVKFRMLHPEQPADPIPDPEPEEEKPAGWKRLFGKR